MQCVVRNYIPFEKKKKTSADPPVYLDRSPRLLFNLHTYHQQYTVQLVPRTNQNCSQHTPPPWWISINRSHCCLWLLLCGGHPDAAPPLTQHTRIVVQYPRASFFGSQQLYHPDKEGGTTTKGKPFFSAHKNSAAHILLLLLVVVVVVLVVLPVQFHGVGREDWCWTGATGRKRKRRRRRRKRRRGNSDCSSNSSIEAKNATASSSRF